MLGVRQVVDIVRVSKGYMYASQKKKKKEQKLHVLCCEVHFKLCFKSTFSAHDVFSSG